MKKIYTIKYEHCGIENSYSTQWLNDLAIKIEKLTDDHNVPDNTITISTTEQP